MIGKSLKAFDPSLHNSANPDPLYPWDTYCSWSTLRYLPHELLLLPPSPIKLIWKLSVFIPTRISTPIQFHLYLSPLFPIAYHQPLQLRCFCLCPWPLLKRMHETESMTVHRLDRSIGQFFRKILIGTTYTIRSIVRFGTETIRRNVMQCTISLNGSFDNSLVESPWWLRVPLPRVGELRGSGLPYRPSWGDTLFTVLSSIQMSLMMHDWRQKLEYY